MTSTGSASSGPTAAQTTSRSSTTTDHHGRRPAMAKAHDPITPGEILLTEFLEPLGITQYRLAQATGLPQTRISEIVRGRRAITTGT
ncbi:MAG: HigA family addiction module antitoxin, partial [Dermatophilaceae bacterium]